MNIYIKNGLVVAEETEGIDTVTEDPSGKFKIGDEYTTEKWEMYNLPFESFLDRKRSEIDSKAEDFVSSLAPDYPEFEKMTFDKQAQEARFYLSHENPATIEKTLSIYLISSQRGLTTEDLAQRIINKDAQFTKITFLVAGLRQKYHDQLGLIAEGDKQAVIDFEVDYDVLM